MTNILLTGGSGFLGGELMKREIYQKALVVGRRSVSCKRFVELSLDSHTDFTNLLMDIDIVVHAAARAHVMNETSSKYSGLYREINTAATLNLAKQSALNGVKRFIFISSIKVLGETNIDNKPFTYLDPLNPQDAYAKSKAEAEVGLRRLSDEYDMEVVIIRPPLVYGKNVQGNFKKILALCAREIPLPLGSINNKRSLVSLSNLVDLITICTTHPKAANQIFLVSDDHDVSISELLTLIAIAGGFKSKLFRVPLKLLRLIFICVGRMNTYERLCGSMQVDIAHTKKLLDWQPLQATSDGLNECLPLSE